MNFKKLLLIISLISTPAITFCQGLFHLLSAKQEEDFFKSQRKYSVAIGTIVSYTESVNGVPKIKSKFSVIGSGLMTYIHLRDSGLVYTVVTAGHVVKYFRDNKISTIYIRPSWADTISTTSYYGIAIPLLNADNFPNTFLHENPKIDLGCIIMLPGYFNKEYLNYIDKNHNPIFPIKSMTTPYLGSQVWIWGYPGHVESQLSNYAICTLKPGSIAWRPEPNTENQDLAHVTLVESNATFGNSGAPVFALQNDNIELIGILTGGYKEEEPIYVNSKKVIDPVTNQAIITESRSGVSIVEKVEYVRGLINSVRIQILKVLDTLKK